MKKTLALLLTLALSMAALTGCGSKTDAPAADSTDSTTGTETPAALSGSVSTNGSTSMEKFANALVLGDSVTQGLSEFGILDAAYVQADRGTGVSEAADNKIEEHLAKAEDLKPQVLFLAYGMNDIEATRGDAKAFAKTYKAVLDRLKESLPDTRIYVNSILPVKQSVIDENEWYGNIGEYNKALEALCEKEDVTFIDNGSLVKEEYYTEDGIHMQPDYYTEWVNHMAEVAGL